MYSLPAGDYAAVVKIHRHAHTGAKNSGASLPAPKLAGTFLPAFQKKARPQLGQALRFISSC
jgi:hypothetical protein